MVYLVNLREDFSSSYDVKQSEPSALVDQQDKADEKDEETIKDDTEPTRLADDSKINMIKSSLVGSQKFAKPQFSDQTIKTNGFVKEMASQEVKDFKSFKFEDKSLPGNGNVRTLMKTLTKSSITPSKKRQVKKIVSKFETVDGKSSKSKSMTPSLQAAVVSGSTRRGKSLLLSAVNNGKENASASEFKHVSHDTPSIKAAVAAKRTKTFKPVGVSDKKKDLLSSPSILAAKGAKMNVGVDLMTAPTEKSLMWTPSRKAAQKAERVTKSMLDFEEILRNGSKAGKNAALPEDLEVPEKVEQVAPIPADEPKDNQDLSSSTRRSPRHKRVMEIPRSNLKTLPLLSSPLRNSIKFESPEGSPNDAITPLASKSTLGFI